MAMNARGRNARDGSRWYNSSVAFVGGDCVCDCDCSDGLLLLKDLIQKDDLVSHESVLVIRSVRIDWLLNVRHGCVDDRAHRSIGIIMMKIKKQ